MLLAENEKVRFKESLGKFGCRSWVLGVHGEKTQIQKIPFAKIVFDTAESEQ